MATADEYRQFANECLRWATEVESENDRQAFLDMARDWKLAAMRVEGSTLIPSIEQQPLTLIRQGCQTSRHIASTPSGRTVNLQAFPKL
jgi:hypothetical protein